MLPLTPKPITALFWSLPLLPSFPPILSLSGLLLSDTHTDIVYHCIWINHKTLDDSISSFLVLLDFYQLILTIVDPDLQGSNPHLCNLHQIANVIFSRRIISEEVKCEMARLNEVIYVWLSGKYWTNYTGLRDCSKQQFAMSDILSRLDLPGAGLLPSAVNHPPWGDTVTHSTIIYLIPVLSPSMYQELGAQGWQAWIISSSALHFDIKTGI